MATARELRVGIRIGATDEATDVVKGMVDRSNGLLGGLAAGGIAMKIKEGLTASSDEFGKQQYALTKLRVIEMNNLGQVNEKVYGDEAAFIHGLSSKYAKTTEDYAKMVLVLRQNRISSTDIIGGVGEANAELAKAFDNLDPDKAALFFARLKNDMRVPAADMKDLANTSYKLFNLGVGGGDATKGVEEITEFFSKASLGAVNLGLKGKEATNELSLLGAVFLNKGLSGTSVGTNFRRIFDGLTDPKRMGAVASRGLSVGVKLNFFDANGNFKGIKHMEEQLNKLKGKNAQTINYVLQPFSGKQGLSIDFLEYLSRFGLDDIETLRKRTGEMANLDDAVKELVSTQEIQNAKTEAAKKNMMAAFGAGMADDVKQLNQFLQSTYSTLGDIASEHPFAAGKLAEIAAASALFLGLKGTLLGIKSAVPALTGLVGGLSAALNTAALAFVGFTAAYKIWNNFKDIEAAKQKQLEENPESKKSKMIRGYDEIINDPNRSAFARHAASALQAGIIRNTQIFGDHTIGTKEYPTEQEYYKDKRTSFLGAGEYKGQSGGGAINENSYLGKMFAPKNETQLTYAPNIVMPAGGIGSMSKDDIMAILKENTDSLMRQLNNEARRQQSMSYGTPH